MKIKWVAPLICLAFVSCNEAKDQGQKKRATKDTSVAKDSDSNPDGDSATSSNGSGSKKSNSSSSGNSERIGSSTKCKVASFKNDLSGSLSTDISATITATVTGDANLAIKNSADELSLDLDITNVDVDAGLLSGIAQDTVEAELAKTTGKRIMLPLTDDEYEDLAKEGDEWDDYACTMGMVKKYTFPVDGGTVTVSFDPALPFAPYPDQVDSAFLAEVKRGIKFADIKVKVEKVNSTAVTGIAKGDQVTGDVILSASGKNIKVVYDFGSFAQLKKTGLFESAVYEYSADNIKAVTLTSPVENEESIEVRFN